MIDIQLKENERIDLLVRENLRIIQSPAVFSFGMDAVLLAGFPKIPKKGLILDLCAGNGAVGLLASNQTQAKIIAIELQEKLANMAERSGKLNQLSEDKFQVICAPLSQTLQYVAPSSADLIFCNPPYFKVKEKSRINEQKPFSLARHELTTNFAEVCQISNQVLKAGGHLTLIHRPERFLELLKTLEAHHFAVKRIQFVYPKPDAEANLVLIDAIKDGRSGGEHFLPPLIVRDVAGNYSIQINKIYYGK